MTKLLLFIWNSQFDCPLHENDINTQTFFKPWDTSLCSGCGNDWSQQDKNTQVTQKDFSLSSFCKFALLKNGRFHPQTIVDHFFVFLWLKCVGRNFSCDWVKDKIQIACTGSISKRRQQVVHFLVHVFTFLPPSLQKESCLNIKKQKVLPVWKKNSICFLPRLEFQFACFRPIRLCKTCSCKHELHKLHVGF